MSIASDLFKGPGNQAWELARFLSAWAVASYSFAFLWALLWLQKVPEWAGLGTGYGAILLGALAGTGIKDFAKAKAQAVTSAAATASDQGVVP